MRRILLSILLFIPFTIQAQQDFCSGALSLCGTSTINGTTAGATASGTDPALTCGDLTVTNNVWFKVLGTGAGSVTVTVSNIDNNPGLAMQAYTGACGSLVPVGPCNSANGPAGSMSITFGTSPGTTYYIMVDGEGGNGESFSITATSATNSIVARPSAVLLPNPTNGCSPLNVLLRNQSTLYGGTNITYQWRILPGGSYINSTGSDTTITLTIPQAYQVELRVCNAECGCNSSLQDVVVQNLVPTIGFSPASACLNTPINFFGAATIEPSPPIVNPNVTSWSWNFGDPNSGASNTANSQNATHTFVGPGSTFTVRLIVDGICGPDTATQLVTLHPRPRVSITPPSLTVCQGSAVNLASTTTNATTPITYLWSGPPTIVSPNSASTAITGLLPGGPYAYSLHIVDSNGCIADTSANVTIRPKPIVNAGADDTVCFNTNYILNGTVIAGIQPLTYTWTPAAGLSSTTILTPSTTVNATKTYCLSARDSFGCLSDTDCVTLRNDPRPAVSSGPTFLCTSMNPPLQTTFTVSGAVAGSTFSWKNSPSYIRITGSNADSSVVTATFPNVVASYNFTVIVFNAITGCRDTLNTSFSVVAGINISSGTNRTICQGTSAPLTASGATTYAWTASPAYSFVDSTQANQTVSPTVTTSFIVRGIVGSCYEEDTVVITVRPKPVVNAGPDDTVCVNSPTVLNGTLLAGIPPMTYLWTPSTGLSSTSILNPTATISTARTYCLKATDSTGCASDSDCVTLNVFPLPTVSSSPATLCASMNPPLQATFTVNGAGAGSTFRWRLSSNYSLITSSNVDSSVVTATFPPGVAASYSFKVIVFNPTTGCSDTLTTAFTVTAGLNMTTTSNQTICAGASTNLTASGASTYLWTAAPVYPFVNPTSAAQNVTPAGTTTFYVTGTTGTCYDQDTVVVTVRPKPVVNAGPDDTLCSFTPTLINASVSAGLPPLTYSWNPSAGLSSSTVLNPTASINATRTYCLVARDSIGCTSDTDCVTLNVYPKPQINSPSVLCASQAPPFQATFNVTGAGAGSTYSWVLSPNYSLITSSAPDSSSITATFPTGVAATYNFTAIVIDGITGCHDTVMTAFVVNPGLTMNVTPSLQVCDGTPALLTATGATTYAWTSAPAYAFADPTSDTQNVVLSATTTFYVTGTTGTCSDIDTIVVTVNPLPVANIGALPAFCRCDTVTLDGSLSTGGLSYLWTSASGNPILNATQMNASAVICADDTITLRVTDPSTTCRSTASVVATPRIAPAASATVNPSQICDGVLTLVTLTGNADTSLTFLWSSNPFVNITDTVAYNTTAFPSTVTIFYLTVSDALGCDTTVSDTVDVYPFPTISASDPYLCTSDPLLISTISIAGTGLGSTFFWDSIPACVTPQTPSGSSQAFDFSTCGVGIYRFVVTVIDGVTGCTKTLVQTVSVIDSVTLILTSDQSICEGDSVMLIASGANQFFWNTGSMNDTIYAGDSLTASATPYDFIVTGTVGSCSATDTVHITVNPRPSTTPIIGPVTVCEFQTAVSFYTITAVPGVNYTWVVNGGTITSGQGNDTLGVNWSAPGGGTVTVYDTNTFGCGGTPQTLNVTINALPATPVIAGPDTVCQNDFAVYSVPLTPGITYQWSVTNGTIIGPSTADTLKVQWLPAGIDSVILILTNAANCQSDSGILEVLVLPIPGPNFINGNISVCEADSNQLYFATEYPGSTYQWIVSGGTLTGGQGTDSITVNWGTSGFGLIRMVETSANGCFADTNYLNVSMSQQPIVTASPDTLTLCNNLPIQLAGTATSGTIVWTTSGTGIFSDSTILNPVYTPGASDTGTVYVRLIASNPPCISDTDVVVLNLSPAPVAAIVSASGGTICFGTTDTLTGSGIGSYLWLPDSVTTPILFANPADTTTYYLIVSNSLGCADTDSIVINVIPPGTPNGGPDQWICTGDSVLLNGTVQNAGGLQWSTNGDGTFSPNTLSANVTYHPGVNDSINGFVDIHLTSLGGCLNLTDAVRITITPYPVVFAGNDTSLTAPATLPLHGSVTGGFGLWYTTGTGTFTPNDTVLNAIYEPSQADYDADSIKIYLESTWSCITVIDSFMVRFFNFEIPNVFTPYPASPGYNDYFIIRGLKPGTGLKIWDRWGLLVFETDNYRNDWDAAELKSDTYYYILSTLDKDYKGWIKVLREE